MGDILHIDPTWDFPGDPSEKLLGGAYLELRNDRHQSCPLRLLDEQDWGWPETQPDFVQGRETEGGLKIGEEIRNRLISLKLLIVEPDEFFPRSGDTLNVATNYHTRPDADELAGQVTASSGLVAVNRIRTVEPFSGDVSREVIVSAGAEANGGFYISPTGLQANTWYAFVVPLMVAVAGQPMQLTIQFRDASNAILSTTNLDFTPAQNMEWVVRGLKALAPSGTTQARCYCRLNNASQVFTFYVDLLTFTEAWYPGNVTDPYPNYMPGPFCGNTLGCSWTGARGDSTSTRPASGGPRFDEILADLDNTIAKIKREGGLLRRRTRSGRRVLYDLQDAARGGQISGEAMRAYHQGKWSTNLELTALPYGRGPQRDGGTATNTDARYAELIVPDIPGDSPALLTLEVTNTNASLPIRHVAAGSQVRNYSSSPLARIHYEAEELTALGGAVRSNVPTWASQESGATAKVLRKQNLSPSWQALMSTRIRTAADYPGTTGTAGKNLIHVGSYLVRARVYLFEGPRSEFTFEYRVGEATAWERLDVVRPGFQDLAVTLDFGVIHIEQLPTVGSAVHQWEGRLLCRSYENVYGDDCDIDYIEFLPVDECFFECRSPEESLVASSVDIEEAFTFADDPAVNLSTKSGWTTGGDTNDFTVGVGHSNRARRAISDFNAGAPRTRWAYKGTPDSNDRVVVADWQYSADPGTAGLYAIVGLVATGGASIGALLYRSSSGFWYVGIGHQATPSGSTVPNNTQTTAITAPTVATSYTLKALLRHSTGTVDVWFGVRDTELTRYVTGYRNTLLDAGQGIASGAPGFVDSRDEDLGTAYPVNRDFDSLSSWVVPPRESIVEPNSKKSEFRADGAFRESAADTTLWTPMTVEGDRPRVLPAGRRKLAARVFATGGRVDPAIEGDAYASVPFNLTARYIPRWLGNPEEV